MKLDAAYPAVDAVERDVVCLSGEEAGAGLDQAEDRGVPDLPIGGISFQHGDRGAGQAFHDGEAGGVPQVRACLPGRCSGKGGAGLDGAVRDGSQDAAFREGQAVPDGGVLAAEPVECFPEETQVR